MALEFGKWLKNCKIEINIMNLIIIHESNKKETLLHLTPT